MIIHNFLQSNLVLTSSENLFWELYFKVLEFCNQNLIEKLFVRISNISYPPVVSGSQLSISEIFTVR